MDNKSLDNKSIDNKSLDNKFLDNKSLDNKSIDNKSLDNKSLDNISVSSDEVFEGFNEIKNILEQKFSPKIKKKDEYIEVKPKKNSLKKAFKFFYYKH